MEQGHDVTLFTRGKKDVTSQIPDDAPDSYANFKASIKHIKGDRMVSDAGQRPPESLTFLMGGGGALVAYNQAHGCCNSLWRNSR